MKAQTVRIEIHILDTDDEPIVDADDFLLIDATPPVYFLPRDRFLFRSGNKRPVVMTEIADRALELDRAGGRELIERADET